MTITQIVSRLKTYLGPTPPSDTAIQDSVLGTFAAMCGRSDFWFMRAADPHGPHSFTAGTYQYDKEIIGAEKILGLGVEDMTDSSFDDIEYAEPKEFRRIKSGQMSPGGLFWTLPSLVSPNNFRLWFYPTPDATFGRFQIYYQMKADGNSIVRMPDRWIRCLTAGVVSELKNDPNAEIRYQEMLAGLPAHEKIVTTFQPQYDVNDYDAQRNLDNTEYM